MKITMVPFTEVFKDVSAQFPKVRSAETLPAGEIAVVDQGKNLINGFTNGLRAPAAAPRIVFGDHTKALKFVDFPFVSGADGTKVLDVRPGFDPKFAFHYLRTVKFPSAGYSRHYKFLKEATVPAIALDEQHRIAAILDQADAVRAQAVRAVQLQRSYVDSRYSALFGSAPRSRVLSDAASVTSGITKGRRTTGVTQDVPYLAVSNVQAGHLALDSVKTIQATAEEVDRYRLRGGDLVLTEGGDPDKLGRGTVWRDELPLAIHQNHIFRVRLHDEEVMTPTFLSALLRSGASRSYFLRSAKQTTGIASINMSQLRALPIPSPSQRDVELFSEDAARAEEGLAHAVARATQFDALFASLQTRAFRGEL